MAKLESVPPVWGEASDRLFIQSIDSFIIKKKKTFEFLKAFLFLVIENCHTAIVSSQIHKVYIHPII